jgi:hypothetical protein
VIPKTILLTCGEYPASRLLTDPATASRVIGLDLYDLEHAGLEGYSGLLVPIHADQRFLMTVQDKLELFWVFGNRCGMPQYIVVIKSKSSQGAPL